MPIIHEWVGIELRRRIVAYAARTDQTVSEAIRTLVVLGTGGTKAQAVEINAAYVDACRMAPVVRVDPPSADRPSISVRLPVAVVRTLYGRHEAKRGRHRAKVLRDAIERGLEVDR